jgi:hypothetical protein
MEEGLPLGHVIDVIEREGGVIEVIVDGGKHKPQPPAAITIKVLMAAAELMGDCDGLTIMRADPPREGCLATYLFQVIYFCRRAVRRAKNLH